MIYPLQGWLDMSKEAKDMNKWELWQFELLSELTRSHCSIVEKYFNRYHDFDENFEDKINDVINSTELYIEKTLGYEK